MANKPAPSVPEARTSILSSHLEDLLDGKKIDGMSDKKYRRLIAIAKARAEYDAKA
jgi:hypothetical protein